MEAIREFVSEAAGLEPGDVSGALALRERFEEFLRGRQLGVEGACEIRYIWACIGAAERGEGLPAFRQNFLGEVDEANLALAEVLYDLGRKLYEEEFEDFSLSLRSDISTFDLLEIKRHVALCGGDLDLISHPSIRLKSVQGILGYAHVLSGYYTGETPYPSMIEVHGIFQDLDFILHSEEN